MRKYLITLLIVPTLIMLCTCGKVDKNVNESTYNYNTTAPSTTSIYNFHTETDNILMSETYVTTSMVPVTEAPETDEITETQQAITQPPLIITEQETIAQTTEKVYEKTGEMAFSDSADNKYINTIVNKYGVDSKNLVALYTVPENDGNMVLEFDGSTDGNGKLIRTKDTLISIYTIDKNLNSKRASENRSLNEYSYGEMKVMFISTTKYIMPEFENELNG